MKYFLALFFLSIFTCFGQNIKGKVIDTNTKLPIENVSVYLKNLNYGTITDKTGDFKIKTNSRYKNIDSVSFSIIGYYPKRFTMSQLKETNVIIELSKKTEQLEEVTVTTNQKLHKYIPLKTLAPLEKGIHSFASLIIDTKIYVVGGDASYIEDTGKKALLQLQTDADAKLSDLIERITLNPSWEYFKDELLIYDITKNEWTASNLNFRKRSYHNMHDVDNSIYILGGKRLSKFKKKEYLDETIEVYNLKKDTILLDEANPHQAVNFASFNYKSNLIVMGGSIKQDKSGRKYFTNKSHIYNIESGYWYALKPLTKPKEVKGVLIDNTIYLIGGFNGTALTEIESFNISAGQWSHEGNLFKALVYPALAHHENTIYILEESKILTYNLSTKLLNEYRIKIDLKASRMHYYDEKLYIIGGYIKSEYSKTPSSKVYSIDLSEFDNTEINQSKKLNP